MCGADLGGRAEELARHWLRTTTPQMPLKAAEHSIRAGERALDALAPAEALDWFQRAIEVLDQTQEADPGMRCDAVIGLGDAQRQLGDPEYSETLLEACELGTRALRRPADGPRRPRQHPRLHQRRRPGRRAPGRGARGRPRAVRGGPDRRAALLSLLAVELSYDADLERRLSLSAEGVRLAGESGDRHALAWALARRQIAIAAAETLEERLAEADEMVTLADDLGDTMLRYWAHVWRAMDALEIGDLETQGRHRAVQEEIAEATGQPMFHWVNTFAPALLATLAGDFERAEEITNRSAELGSESGQPDVLAIYAAQIHVIRYEQGRLDEVLEIQEQAVAEAPLLDAYSSALALSYIELEDSDKARAVLERLAAKRFTMTATLSSRPALCFMAEVAARLGDRDSCALLHEKLLPFRDQLCYSGVTLFGTIERYLGLTATCAGPLRGGRGPLPPLGVNLRTDRGPDLARPHPPRVGADAPAPRAVRRSRDRRVAAGQGARRGRRVRVPHARAAGLRRDRGPRSGDRLIGFQPLYLLRAPAGLLDRDPARPFERRWEAGISSWTTAPVRTLIWPSRKRAIRSSSRRIWRASFAVSRSPTFSARVSIAV